MRPRWSSPPQLHRGDQGKQEGEQQEFHWGDRGGQLNWGDEGEQGEKQEQEERGERHPAGAGQESLSLVKVETF